MQLLNVLLVSATLIKVGQLFLALSLLILLHEFGHFFFARLFKTRVEKFYLFFDFLFPLSNVLPFSLFKKKIGDTEYGIGWFPLGGYVKIAGMVDESMDTEQMQQPPQPWEYRSKKPYQRLFIMLGGIIVNVILGILIYSMVLFVWGQKKLPVSEMKIGVSIIDSIGYKLGFKDGDQITAINGKQLKYYDDLGEEIPFAKNVTVVRNGMETSLQLPENFVGRLVTKKRKPIFSFRNPAIIGEVSAKSNAAKAGLKAKDEIKAINGQPISYFDEMQHSLDTLKGKTIQLQVKRDSQIVPLTCDVSPEGKLGVVVPMLTDNELEEKGFYRFETIHYSLLQAVPAGLKMSWEQVVFYARQFRLIFDFKTEAYKGVGGFATMTQFFPPVWDWELFWTRTAFISLVLAFMNLLPIPGLDGGYVLFLIFEMITGKQVSDKVMERATGVGLLLLLALMVYANGMDIYRGFKGLF